MPRKAFFETPGGDVLGFDRGGGPYQCTGAEKLAIENPNYKLVQGLSRMMGSENTTAFIYHEGLSIMDPDSHCALSSIVDHKYYFSPGRYLASGNDICYQELCHITTKAYNAGGSVFRYPDNGTGCTAFIEGQYPYDPELCDIYAMEMCLAGYDVDNVLGDAPSSSFYWDDITCACKAGRRRALATTDFRRKALALAHSQ